MRHCFVVQVRTAGRSVAIFAVALAVSTLAPSARGEQRVSVKQLDAAVAGLKGKPDVEAGLRLADLRLTERLNSKKLAELEIELTGESGLTGENQQAAKGGPAEQKDSGAGVKCRQALEALADESEFLAPPAEELPAKPAPDPAEQRRIMGLVVTYVGKTIPVLPNLVADRVTSLFEDNPLLQQPGGFIPYEPMHFLNTVHEPVVYKDKREATMEEMRVGRKRAAEGLTTWGVFGPILSTVLVDAAQSRLAWSRWEQEPDGPRAVFSYAVPASKSHYEVNFCCVAEQAGSVAANVHLFRKTTAYHGEMAVDPATGEIRRLTVEAELKVDDPVVKAGIAVEYGPVEIGGREYICPVHSVSLSQAETVQVDPTYHFEVAHRLQPLKWRLNDVRFENYHVFRGETRVLAGGEMPAGGAPSGNGEAAAGEPGTQTGNGETSPAGNTAAEATAAAAPVVAPEPEIPEMTMTVAGDLPDGPGAGRAAGGAAGENGGFTLHTTSKLVDVTLVAFDKKGRPVTDLKANELQVEDNGRPQEVRFFGQAAGSGPATVSVAGPATNVTGTEAAPVYNNRTVAAPSAEGNSTVLLIDASHVAFGDLNYAREEMLRFLQKTPADERMGLYVLRSTGFDVLREPDTDRERLVATLKAWMPSAQDLQRAQDEEQRNRQQIEYVHNVPDLASVNGNGQGGNDPEMYTSGKSVAAAAAYPPDAALRPLGDRPEEAVLYLLVGVGRHLAAIRGHKMLVWVSSDNVLADFGSQTVGREDTGNKFLDPASLRAREALNEAHVSIYPLDVSQLEVGGTGADIGTHNVLVVGHSDRDKANSVVGDAGGGMSPGRDTARMQEDTHPIQGAFRDLAAATGGRAFRRSGDIANELDSVVADGRAAYLLSFSPDGPADDKYHTLRVKTMRAGVTLRYRTGYQYSKEPATLKERFRKAVWEAGDGTEIGLTATMAGKDLDVRIAGSDLALAEQGGRWTGTVDVFVVTREKGGLHASATGQRMGLKLKASTYAESVKEGIPVREPLSGTGTADSVRVIVVDEGSGRMGWITLQPTADGRQ